MSSGRRTIKYGRFAVQLAAIASFVVLMHVSAPSLGAAQALGARELSDLFHQVEDYLQRKEKGKALQTARTLQSGGPKSAKLHLFIGTLFAKYGHYSESLSFFNSALRSEPGLYEARYNAALASLKLGNPQDAIGLLQSESSETSRGRADFQNLLGNAYWRAGEVGKAAAALQQAYRLEADREDYYLDAGTFFLEFNTPQPAIKIFEAGTARLPDSSKLAVALGVSLIVSGEHSRGQKLLVTLIAQESTFRPAYFPLGFSYYHSQNYGAAEDILSDAINRFPHDYWSTLYLALTLKESAKRERGYQIVDLLETCISLKPTEPGARLQLASVYSRQGRFEKVIHLLRPVIARDPKLLPARRLLAVAYFRSGDTRMAEQEKKVIKQLEEEEQGGAGEFENDLHRRALKYVLADVRN